MSASTLVQNEEGKTVQLSEDTNTNYFPTLLSNSLYHLLLVSLEVTSSVQSRAALRLQTDGVREAESQQGLHFPPISLPCPQWGLQIWAEQSWGEGQEESQQQKASRGSPGCPTPPRFEDEQRNKKKKRFSVKLSYGVTVLGKRARQQRESLGISRAGCDFNILSN